MWQFLHRTLNIPNKYPLTRKNAFQGRPKDFWGSGSTSLAMEYVRKVTKNIFFIGASLWTSAPEDFNGYYRRKTFLRLSRSWKSRINQVKQIYFICHCQCLDTCIDFFFKGVLSWWWCVCMHACVCIKYFTDTFAYPITFFRDKFKAWYPTDHLLRFADLAHEDCHVVI